MGKYKVTGCLVKYDTPWFDGTVIKPGACDQHKVEKIPVLFKGGFAINDAEDSVIGYAELEYRDDGVYATAYLNDDENAEKAFDMISNQEMHIGLIANNLTINDKREVSGMSIRSASINHKCDDASWIDKVEDLT